MTQQMKLFDALARHEGVDVEYKSAKGGLPKSLWETYSAFANTAGGTLYLGVKETDDGLEFQGIREPEKLLTDFWNGINNRQKLSMNILEERHVTVEKVQGAAIVVVEIPRASRRERPVYVGVDPYKGTYRRNHEGDFRCNEFEVQRMFADRLDQEPPDSRILEYFDLGDLDSASLKQFRNRMASRSPDHPWLSEDDQDFLRKLGGWRKDRQSGAEGLTLAGLLMFGKTEAIQDNTALPGFHLDYRERLADDENTRWSDRLTIDGTWEANLFQFYQRMAQKLARDPALKVPFQRDEQGYRKGQTEVHEALQEALVNSLIHADHHGQGGIVIDRFKERFELSNPGTLLLSVDQLLVGGVSECRNKSLQKMFQLLGVGDKAGSGLDKIRSSWHAQLWQPPSLRETLRPDRVILTLPMISMLPDDVMALLERRFGNAFRRLSEDEVQALVTAITEGRVTNQRLQEMLSRHRVDITQMLQGLVEKGMLEPHGRRRGTYYILAPADDTDHTLHNEESPLYSGVSSERSAASSLHSSASSEHNDTSSVHNIVSSEHSRSPALHAMSPELHQRLKRIAEPVGGSGRAPPELMEATILALCAHEFLSLHELAALLKRHPNGLRIRHINKLVRAGKLRLRYPDKPNHSQQGYRTVEGASE